MSRIAWSWAEAQEGMRQALGAVKANKFRSIMTIIGVMIGVGAVILVNTIMDGFTRYAEASVDRIGSNVMYIQKWEENTDFDNLTEQERRRKDITLDEALAIQEFCPLVRAVSPEKSAYDNIAKYGNKSIRNPDDFRGCWPTQPIVTNRDCEFGRFFDEQEMQREAKVTVIGPDVADALFDTRADAIGKEIRVNGWKFTVIGVQEKIDDLFNISENDFIYIPMTTFERLYPQEKEVYLLVSAVSRQDFEAARDQVINALRRVRHVRPEEENNFGILTQELFKDEIANITTKVQLGATAVALVGLLVGIIGVMNIMLVAVTQRTREIGIRKAIGARRRAVLFQFLVEAATLTGLGGLVGIVAGAVVGFVVTFFLEWHYSLSILWTCVGLALSVGTGLLAGFYPAWRASRLDPIAALRYE
jgi:putative ABC transport system permease protein